MTASSSTLELVLLGPPGSGKGTQADRLSEHFGLPHIATGDLFRENLKNQTELGKLAKSYMDRGDLVPDDVTQRMVRERFSRPDTGSGFILDGFPRNVPQAQALTEMLAGMGRQLTGVLHIKVSDEEVVKRLSGRVICRECQTPFHEIYNPFRTCPYNKCQGEHLYRRDDDNPETVRARLEVFRRQTAPLVDYFREAGLLVEVPGEGDVAEITAGLLAAVKNIRTA